MHFSRSHLLWLDPADFLGGAELFSLDVLPKLSETFAITILTNDLQSNYGKALPKNVLKQNFLFPRLKPITPQKIIHFFRTVKNLKSVLREKSPDIIFTNSIRAHILASEAVRGLHTSTPPLKRSRSMSSQTRQQAAELLEKIPKLVFFVHDFTFPKWAVRLFSKKADRIFCCSEAVKNDLLKKEVPEEKLKVIPSGVDVERFQKIPRKKMKKNAPVIGMISRIDIWKGQDIFLEAARRLHEKLPAAHFLIFGESSSHDKKTQEFEQKLRNIVSESKMEKYVEFCGFCRVEKALSQIDIVVHASTEPEPFGRILLEAMASEIPIIASNLGGPLEIFGKRLPEFLIPPKNPKILAEKIEEIWSSKTLQKKFRHEGTALISEKYSLEKITNLLQKELQK